MFTLPYRCWCSVSPLGTHPPRTNHLTVGDDDEGRAVYCGRVTFRAVSSSSPPCALTLAPPRRQQSNTLCRAGWKKGKQPADDTPTSVKPSTRVVLGAHAPDSVGYPSACTPSDGRPSRSPLRNNRLLILLEELHNLARSSGGFPRGRGVRHTYSGHNYNRARCAHPNVRLSPQRPTHP